MANDVFTALLKNKIEIFVQSFSILSRQIFYDKEKNKLTHPGEYGIYKEEIVRNFIGMFIPESLSISTGFVLNAIGGISRQLDIVIYNPLATPKIEDANHERFYPIECVHGIGEVKTIIRSKQELQDALLPLVIAKKLAIEKHARNVGDTNRVPFTFLFCDEICGTPIKTNNWIVSIYNENSIDKKYWHNEIASIKSGLFKYATMADIAVNGRTIKKNSIIANPTLSNDQYNKNFHLKSKKNGYHLVSFGHDLSLEFGKMKENNYPDIISYTEEYR